MKFIKIIVALLFTASLYGQSGKIAGTITDASSGETLISSYVFIEGTDKVEASDFDGKYTIELEPGTYTLRFTYIGFADKTVDEIEVNEGEVTYLDVAMAEGSQQLDEVVVTAKIIDKTENSVLLLRRKSDQIQDGLSAQEMRTFAVGNVASAVTKVTAVSVEDGKYVNIRGLGDRYSITQLNGLTLPSIDPYRNSAQLDLIPTNLLDNIITSKTFSPDQPGNFAGGNLNMKTKSFPEERTLSISLSTGYNSQNNLANDFLQYDGASTDWLGYGKEHRARPDFFSEPSIMEYMDKNAELEAKILGDEMAASTINRVVDAVDLNFLSRQVTAPIDHGLSVAYGNSWDSGINGRIGIIAAASYKNSFTNLPEVTEKRWFLSDVNAGELENIGDYSTHRSVSSPIVNGLIGVAYKFNPLNIVNLNVIYNHNTSKETQYVFGEKPENIIAPTFFQGRANLFEEREMVNYQLSGDHVLSGLNNAKIEWSGSYVAATMDQPNLRFFSNQYNSETGNYSIPLSNVEDPLLFWRDLSDDMTNAKMDIEIPLNLNIFKSSKIKFGGLVSSKNRDFNEYRYLVYSPPSGQRFNGDFETFVGEDAVGVLSVEDKGTKNSYTIGNYLIDATRADNSYDGNEDIAAGYLMATIQVIEDFKIVAGVRFESTDINVKSKNELRADSLRTGAIKSKDLLPSINLIYNLTDNMNLRGSYNKTLARPNLREIAPFVAFDPLTGDFIIGNTNLKRTNITNVDLRWELFMQPGEIISAGVFYKHFTNPIIEQYLNSSNPERQYANVDEGEIYGLELEFRKNLGFVAPFLANFKFGSNVAFIQSFTNVNDQTGLEPTERPFTGQAPFLANLNLTYAEPTSELAANLAYNYIGRRLSNIARNGTPDVYNAALNTLDFSLSKQMGKVSLAVNAKNLLNAKFEQSSTFKDQTFVYQSYQRGISFGLTLKMNL